MGFHSHCDMQTFMVTPTDRMQSLFVSAASDNQQQGHAHQHPLRVEPTVASPIAEAGR